MTIFGRCLSCKRPVQRPSELCSDCEAKWAPAWTCWLPFPPSVNNLFFNLSEERRAIIRMAMRRKGKKGEPPSRALTKRYRDWRKEAIIRVRANWRAIQAYPVPVLIKLELVPPDARGRDADNYNKAVLDALVEARVLQGDNNRWVKAVIPYWENPSATSGVIVTIRPAENARKPALDAEERALLASIQRLGLATVPASYRPSAALRSLIEKGYVEPLPGLIEGVPQGYVVA